MTNPTPPSASADNGQEDELDRIFAEDESWRNGDAQFFDPAVLKPKIRTYLEQHTKEAVEAAIRATWYYTSEGYNGEYDGLTHIIGGKRYTEDEVMGKVIADVMAELAAPTASPKQRGQKDE